MTSTLDLDCPELDALMPACREANERWKEAERSRSKAVGARAALAEANGSCHAAFAAHVLPCFVPGAWQPTERGLWGDPMAVLDQDRIVDHPDWFARIGRRNGPRRWATRALVSMTYCAVEAAEGVVTIMAGSRCDLAFVRLPSRWAWYWPPDETGATPITPLLIWQRPGWEWNTRSMRRASDPPRFTAVALADGRSASPA